MATTIEKAVEEQLGQLVVQVLQLNVQNEKLQEQVGILTAENSVLKAAQEPAKKEAK